jgi:hypothetical protein
MTITTTTTTTEPSTAWQAWRDYSDRLAVELAIEAASRRIAAQYSR